MMKSLFSGVSGLKNHTVRMDVIGNNIANVNTMAYKGNTVTFRDVFYQTRSFASAGTTISGGTNPRQVGYGVALGSIDKVMTQSGFAFSDSVYDCAIQGEGFFQVMDAAGNIYYTRNGVFNVDNLGNLVDSNGYIVLGVAGDPTGIGPSSQRINLFIPDVWNEMASAYKTVLVGDQEYGVTFMASGFGPAGNIAVNIMQGEVPFATMNGNVLSVQMDLSQEFASQAAFQDAVNAAIVAGGVNPGDGVLPLNITFSGLPASTAAIAAANNLILTDRSGAVPVNHQMNFTATTPGIHANNYIVAVRTSTSATEVSARWAQNVLTVTLPAGMTDGSPFIPGDPTAVPPTDDIPAVPPVYLHNFTLDDIQAAINRAAGMTYTPGPGGTAGTWDGGNPNRQLTVSVPDYTVPPPPAQIMNPPPGDPGHDAAAWAISGAPSLIPNPAPGAPGHVPGFDNGIGFDIRGLIGTTPRQIGLYGGEDNFFRTAIQKMSTVVMQDGRFAAPQSVRDLDLVFIDSGGVIYGEHPVHGRLVLGRIDLAIFQNANGLQQFGTSYFKESLSSGPPEIKRPESDGAGEIVSGALEMANVDLSQEFSDMIITQRGFQANSRIITVSDTMLEELINLKR
jgi:flagellar hook protein FlgE